ncbi:cell division ATP-binding protein FtsE [Agromyces sp. Marseille-P2726]|uniref:cell division ATP-binding protein FtsE n=1 Tax=Agromyces sp. Marseille-P2726 TaxID=2709132 RepID=UPI00156FF806|nr:cell division ATP-binding protein FtsE [Agromyces sp. Marseille-P2726]
MIRFDSVTKTYPGQSRPALHDIDVEILRGEFVFLVGASGSGKSSFLRLILKEEKPSTGKIHVLGQDLGRISSRKVPYFRRDLGVVFQDFRLLPNKNAYENVAFTLRVIGKSRGFIQSAVPETLRLVGLDGKGKRMPHELSGGEQQRVAIARAIVNKPQILLADEPTGNLDPVTSAGIMTLLERINAGGTTVVMATHEAGIVDEMQRRVIELSAGEVVRDERGSGYGAALDDAGVDEPEPGEMSEPVAGVSGEAEPAAEEIPSDGVAAVIADAASSPAGATVAAASTTAAAAKRGPESGGTTPAKPRKKPAAAPKVGKKLMEEKQPLYVEPEERDEVTDAAAAITAAATASVPVMPDGAAAGHSGDDATAAGRHEGAASEHLTLAQRLGLRAPSGPREGDDDQEVGPTK